jgi:hypothetical protein
MAKEVDGVGDKGSGGTTVVDVHTHIEAFLNTVLRSARFFGEGFLW